MTDPIEKPENKNVTPETAPEHEETASSQKETILESAKKRIDDIYEVREQSEVEEVVTTIGGAVEVTKLGVEISETQKNSLTYRLDVVGKDTGKTTKEIEEGQDTEKQLGLKVIYNAIAVDLVGSYWDNARREINPDWKTTGFDIMKISQQVKPQVTDVMKLDPKSLSPDSVLLLNFLQGQNPLANDIRTNLYPQLVATQQQQMIELFTTYNAFLKKTPEDQEKEKGFFNNTIAVVEKDRDKITDKDTSTGDKAKVALKYVGIAAGGYLAIRAIRWLFGSKDKSKEGSDGKGSSRWKRALGIGGGALALRLFNKRDKNTKPDDDIDSNLPGTVPNEAEVVDYINTVPAGQQTLATLAVQGINEMYNHDQVGIDGFGTSAFESTNDGQIAPGLLIAILQDRHGNVNELLTSSTYYQELLGADVNQIRQEMKKMTVKPLQALGAAVLKPLGGTIVGEFLKRNTVDKMIDYLQEQGVKVETIQQVLRKNLSILSYVNLKKNQLEEVVAGKYLAANDKKRAEYSDERKADEITDLVNNQELYKLHIEPTITKYGLLPLIDLKGNGETFLGVLQNEGILDESLPSETQEQLTDFNDEFADMYECDEFDDHSLFEIDPFENGALSVEGKASVEDVITNMEEHMGDAGKAGFFKSYLPILTLFSTAENTEQEILDQYEPLILPYRELLTSAKTKIADGSFSSTDFDQLKETAQSYKSLNAQWQLTNRSITEIKQENGGTAVTLGNLAKLPGQLRDSGKQGVDKAWTQGLTVFFDGDTRSGRDAPLKVGDSMREMGRGGAQLAGTLLSAELAIWPVRLGLSLAGVGRMPSTPQLIKLPLKGLRRAGGKAGERISRKLTPSWFYKGKENILRYDIMNNKISLERSTQVAEKLGIKAKLSGGTIPLRSGDTRSILRYAFDTPFITDEQADLMIKYWDNTNIRKQLINADATGAKWKFWNKWNPEAATFKRDAATVDQLKLIDEKLITYTDKESQAVLESLLKKSKNLNLSQKIINDRDNIFKTIRVNPLGTRFTPESFFEHRKLQPKDLGRTLAKVKNVDDIPKIMAFIQDSAKAGKIKDPSIFFKKSFALRDKIQANPHAHFERLNGVSRLKVVTDKLDLKGKMSRVGETMKRARVRLISKLRNPTSPFPQAAAAEIDQIDEFFEIAARNPNGLTAAVQQVDGTIELAADVSRATGAETESMSRFLRTNSKAFKFVRGALIGAGVIVGAVEAYGSYTHAQNLFETNPQKADVYIDKALTEAGLVGVGVAVLFIPGPGRIVAGTVGVVEGSMRVAKDTYFDVMDAYTTNKSDWLKKGTEAKQEALLHFLGITMGDSGIERSGKESFARFLSTKSSAEFTKLANQTGDEALAAWLLMDEIEHDKSGIGLLHFIGGESENEILAGLPKDSEAIAARGPAIKNILHNVEKRADYLKNKVGTEEITVPGSRDKKLHSGVALAIGPAATAFNEITAKKGVDTKAIVYKRGEALEKYGSNIGVHTFLRQQLNESRLALQENESYHDGATNQTRLEKLGEEVVKDPRHANLQKLYTADKQQLLYLFYCGHDFLNLSSEMWPAGADKQQAQSNAEYFQKFMEYTSWKTGRDLTTTTFGQGELTYDQTRVKNFLTTLVREDAPLAAIAPASREYAEPQTDDMMIERFGKSPNVIQNVLYDIATQVYGMHIENNIDVLKGIFTETSSERYGLYFTKDGADLRVVDVAGFDYKKLSMAPDQQLAGLRTLRDRIHKEVTDGKGGLITTQTNSGRETLNKEVGGAYLRIIDHYYNQLYAGNTNGPVLAFDRISFDIEKCADTTKGQRFELPPETVTTGIMLGLKDLGSYLYRQREDGLYEIRSKEKGEQLLTDVYPQLT